MPIAAVHRPWAGNPRRCRIAFLLPVAIVSACSVWVAPDESRLEPRDTGPTWCDAPLEPSRILFPRARSGVLGIVPILGEAHDCSGVASAGVRLQFDEGGTAVDTLAGEIYGTHFSAFWDTAAWPRDRACVLVADARPVRTGYGVSSSQPVRVTTFRFDPEMPVSGDPAPTGWAFVDFDNDGDLDLLWDGSLFRHGAVPWPEWDDVSEEAFAVYCGDARAGCSGGRPAWWNPTVADVDGDGTVDIIGEDDGRDKPLWLVLGEVADDGAGGRFWRAREVRELVTPNPNGAVSTLVADFNLDGWLDVLVTRRCEYTSPVTDCTVRSPDLLLMGVDGENWTVLQGTGNTGLEPSLWDQVAVAGDFLGDEDHPRGDGYPDVVITRNLGGPSVAYRNRGADALWQFEKAPDAPLMPSSSPAQLADYDRDGDLDIVFPKGQMYVEPSLWRNEGNGTLVEVTAAAGYPGGILADINNDGFLDAGTVLGSPDDTFVQTGVSAVGIPFDVNGDIAQPALGFVQGTGPEAFSRSDLVGTGRIVARVDVPTLLPHNRFGVGTRVELVTSDDAFDSPGNDEWSVAEIAPLWGGASFGFEVQFGVDPAGRYRLRFRLPTRDLQTCILDGVTANRVVTLHDTDCPSP